MATNFVKEKSIGYINRDFRSFRSALVKFSQAHHSGVFKDDNEASGGAAVFDLVSYVGANLAFYQDMQFEELRGVNARQIENIVSFAKMKGYRPAGKRAAQGIQTFFVEVPATTVNSITVPDDSYTPVLRAGAKLPGPNGVVFETLEDIHFSASAPTFGTNTQRMVTGSSFNQTTGIPTYYAIRKDVPIVAGETKEETFYISEFKQFRTIELGYENVTDIISIKDSDGNDYFEVEYLPQETVFETTVNDSSDGDVVPYVLKLKPVPRRFVIDRDPLTNKTSCIFGSGDGINFDDELVPNLADLAIPLIGRRTFSSYAVDPRNFTKTRSMGLSPYNTTLTVRYRIGGGQETNVPAATIRDISESVLDFSTSGLNAAAKSRVIRSLETTNVRATEGGGSEETIDEIKANSGAYFAAQKRAVTREDFIAHIMSIPERLGRPEKVFIKKSVGSSNAVDVHMLSTDSQGKLTQPTQTLMSNIKNFVSPIRMLTDGINIYGCDIINFRVEFGIVVSPRFKESRNQVIADCISIIRDYFDTKKMQISQPILLSEISSELQQLDAVISVYKLNIKNVFGTLDASTYSDVRYDMRANTVSNIIYAPRDAIFELKYPKKDIAGESK